MSYTLRFSKNALEDLDKHKKTGNQVTLKKIEKLLKELREHPYTGTGRPEKLKFDLAGLHSRRINQKHRLVYAVEESTVVVLILSAWAHYDDK